DNITKEDTEKFGNKFHNYSDLAKMRSDEQGFGDRLGNMFVRIGANVIGGTLESIGSVPAAAKGAYDLTRGEDVKFNNSLMDLGEGIKEWGRENFPNYMSGEVKPFDYVDNPNQLFDHVESLFSTLEYLI